MMEMVSILLLSVKEKNIMIITENRGKWVYTHSDQRVMIRRNDGVLFEDAYDKVGSGHTYTETDIVIKNSEDDGV